MKTLIHQLQQEGPADIQTTLLYADKINRLYNIGTQYIHMSTYATEEFRSCHGSFISAIYTEQTYLNSLTVLKTIDENSIIHK